MRTQVEKSHPLKRREIASEQVVIGFSFYLDRSRGWRKFIGQLQSRSE